MELLKQNTAATILVGPVLDSTGAAYTGMAITDFNLTKNGTTAAMAAAASVTHSHEGHYLLTFTTGNTDTLGRLVVSCNKSGYAMPPARFSVLKSTAFDALITNGDILTPATAVSGGNSGELQFYLTNGATYASLAATDTAMLVSRLTSTRAAYLDNLAARVFTAGERAWVKFTTGLNLYIRVFQPDTGYVYRQTNGGEFVAYQGANWDTQWLTMTELGTTGWYYAEAAGDIDTEVNYVVDVWKRIGLEPASNDTKLADGAWGPETEAGLGDLLSEVLARVNAARITYQGPISNTLTATIIQGDTYTTSDLVWTVEDYTGPSVSGSTGKLRICKLEDFNEDGAVSAELEVDATASMVGADLVITSALTAAQTAALESSPPDDKWNYVYQVVLTLSGGSVLTPDRATGAMTVNKRVGPSA